MGEVLSGEQPKEGKTISQTSPVQNVIRASVPPPVAAAPLEMGDAADAVHSIRVTTRYVTVDGRPWIPVMGEYHFCRDRPERWERELRKMRSGGVTVLATYLIWNAHEDVEGEIRWDGHRDVRRFVELADRAGLKVMLRIGPWAHGESRNGGFPDWLQELPITHRSNDPAYLAHVERWYRAIEEQVRGLFHTPENPAGPIVGIQVDNELYDNGPHLATLRDLAESVGMRASLWTATGWGGAELPPGRVLPVYAGYPDGFWEESTTGWPDFGAAHFSYSTVRDDLTVGADLRSSEASSDGALGADDPWPFVTCELGGGMAVAYHRRPLVDPDDVASLALAKVGSGSSWQGYYMYHGGLQVDGRASSLQESQATGYPNDVPVRDYDFFAPLGTVGSQRPHFHKLRQQHLMLDAFGAQIAGATTTIPNPREGRPRWAVRSDGQRGFLFANNHQPAIAALPGIDGVQFDVELDGSRVRVPAEPVTLPSGAYFAWPLRQRLGTLAAVTATAQLITQFDGPRGPVVLLAATTGIGVEIQVEKVRADDVAGAKIEARGETLILRPDSAPGTGCEVEIAGTTLVVLDQATAESVWRGEIDGRDSVVLWPGSGWFEGGFRAVLGDRESSIDVWPPLRHTEMRPGEGSVFSRHAVPAGAHLTALDAPAFASRPAAPLRHGGSAGRLSAPTDFSEAATLSLAVPREAFGEESTVLALDWRGDVMRVHIGDQLIADQFWYGRPLEIDLQPYRDALADEPLTIRAFAWAPHTGVYVDSRVRPASDQPILEIRSAVVTAASTRVFT